MVRGADRGIFLVFFVFEFFVICRGGSGDGVRVRESDFIISLCCGYRGIEYIVELYNEFWICFLERDFVYEKYGGNYLFWGGYWN